MWENTIITHKIGEVRMRGGYSILREIHRKDFMPNGKDYGLLNYEFDNMIRFLEKQGYLERVLRVGDAYSLKPAKLTLKGLQLLKDKSDYEETYPARNGLIEWVRSEKEHYSNY